MKEVSEQLWLPFGAPMPEMDGMNIDGRQIGPATFAIGALHWNGFEWTCLADHYGMLCLVSVTVKKEN